jgi:hypothetical protein
MSTDKKCGMWNTKVVGCSGFCVGWQNLWDDQCISRRAELGRYGHTAGCPQTINGITSLSRHMDYIKPNAKPMTVSNHISHSTSSEFEQPIYI